MLDDCDCIRFSDGYWYKFTKKGVTFGDDYADIGMLTLCGKGIAMGNAINEVKEIADLIIGSNDEDGIAEYLRQSNWILL